MKQDLNLFFRHLMRSKVISGINVFGLVIGILSALFILEYVYYERSYDSHHEHAEDIYRLAYNRYDADDKVMWETANSFFPAGDWLKDNYSEVIDQARITPKHNITVHYTDEQGNKVYFSEPRAFYGTTSMFDVFAIPLLQGDNKGLDNAFTVAISAAAAHKYFGMTNPIGKVLKVNGNEDYTVCCVYEDIPRNSIIRTDFLFSMETMYHFRPGLRTIWGYDYGTTYLQMQPGTDQKTFTDGALVKMVADNYKARLDRQNQRDVFYLQALRDIHLTSNIEYETVPAGNGKIISILWGFALFLLIVAWINYVNITTAQSVDRAKEIGVKKINGASRFKIINQFISEAFVLNIACLCLTLLLFWVLNPLYRSVIGIGSFNLFHYSDFLTTALGIFVLGIFTSCIYPALILQSYKPISVLRGKFKHSRDGIFFRKSMITLQFMISIILLSGTTIAKRQANHLQEQDMGVDYSRSIVISTPQTGEKQGIIYQRLLSLKNEILRIPGIVDYTFNSDVPLREIETWIGFRRKGFDNSDNNGYFHLAVDDHFINFFDIDIIAGRSFYEGETSASGSIILNLKAIERMGVADPDKAVNTIVIRGDKEFKVVGVTNDFHYMSIKNDPVPTVITLNNPPKRFLCLKLSAQANDKLSPIISQLEDIYTAAFPDQPFNYYLLDDKVEMDLKPDKTFSFVFGLFSILAILIAIVGMIGLILITVEQRMKEIGVRKTLGATLGNITKLLLKEVTVQFIIAIFIAIPLAWYGFQNWFLASYIHHIAINIGIFVLPIIILVLIIYVVIYAIAINTFKVEVSKVLQNE